MTGLVRRSVFRAPTTTTTPGVQGDPGMSAYQQWVQAGHQGTPEDFLTWLRGADGQDGNDGQTVHGEDGTDGTDGEDGAPGKSAYELAVQEGFTGTLAEWLASLHGRDGEDGEDGEDGTDGKPGTSPVVARGETALTATLLGGAFRTVTVQLNKAMPSQSFAPIVTVTGWGMSVESTSVLSPTEVNVVVKNNLLTAILAGAAAVRVVAIG